MIEVVSIEEIKKGDIILIEGWDDAIHVVTVEEVTEDGLIIPAEFGGLDYAVEDPDQIVKIGYMSRMEPGTVICIDSPWVTAKVKTNREIG